MYTEQLYIVDGSFNGISFNNFMEETINLNGYYKFLTVRYKYKSNSINDLLIIYFLSFMILIYHRVIFLKLKPLIIAI